MARWEIGDIEKLQGYILANDSIIKDKMGGVARISIGRVAIDPAWFPYIYGLCIPGVDASGQGTSRVQSNPGYDWEVRTRGAFTQTTEDLVDRIDALFGTMVKRVTLNGLWVVSMRRVRPISIIEPGASPDEFFTRRGAHYKLAVVSA